MPRMTYVHGRKFRPETLAIIQLADEIASDYRARGFDLTLRQLYYQFVARDLLRNTEQSYKGQEAMRDIADRWSEVTQFLEENPR